jgi:DNA-binding transcriptional LysR family regulator
VVNNEGAKVPDQLQAMRTFVKVAETGSFAAAASQLGWSSQVVGRQVAGLEHRLSVRLLNRTTHAQSLTEAGKLYLDECRSVLAQIEAIDSRISAHVGKVQGCLRITAPIGLGTILARKLPGLLADHSALRIELHLSDKQVDLVAEGFDAGIRIGNLADCGLIARSLGLYACVTCASPSYLEQAGRPVLPHDLPKYDCLDFIFPSHPAPHLWTFVKDGETVRVEPETRFVVNDGRALVEAALNGFGIIQVGEIKVRDELASGRLVQLLADWETPARQLQLVFPGVRQRTPALRAFADWLVGVLSSSN